MQLKVWACDAYLGDAPQWSEICSHIRSEYAEENLPDNMSLHLAPDNVVHLLVLGVVLRNKYNDEDYHIAYQLGSKKGVL